VSGNGPEHPETTSVNGTGHSETQEDSAPSLADAETVQVPVPADLDESGAESAPESDPSPDVESATAGPSESAGVNGNGHGQLGGMPPPWQRMPAVAKADRTDPAVAEDHPARDTEPPAESASIGELTGAGSAGAGLAGAGAAGAGTAGAGTAGTSAAGSAGADFSDYTDYDIPGSRTRGSVDPPTVRTRTPKPSAHPRAAAGASSARSSDPDEGGTVGGFPMSWPRNRRPRQAALQLKRLDPWSVLKVALVLAVVLYLVWLVAVGVLYGVLDGLGVWERLNGQYADLVAEQSGQQLISAGRVFGVAAVIGAVNSLLFAVALSVGAFVYNVSADLVGGVEVTLSERD
jgi:hypothetical protein